MRLCIEKEGSRKTRSLLGIFFDVVAILALLMKAQSFKESRPSQSVEASPIRQRGVDETMEGWMRR